MKVIEATKSNLVLKPTRRDETFGKRGAFIFDIDIIPDNPTPKRLIIRKQSGRTICTWSMSWSKFLNETCIDTIVILRKDKMTYRTSSEPTP